MSAHDHLSPQQFGYHISPASNRESIYLGGLKESQPSVPHFPVGVYFSRNVDDTLEYWDGGKHDIWRFPLDGKTTSSNEDGLEYTGDVKNPERYGFVTGDGTVVTRGAR